MTKEYVRVIFPLDLTCPACQSTPVRFTVVLPASDGDHADVEVSCPCGQEINYGSVPVEMEPVQENGLPVENEGA